MGGLGTHALNRIVMVIVMVTNPSQVTFSLFLR